MITKRSMHKRTAIEKEKIILDIQGTGVCEILSKCCCAAFKLILNTSKSGRRFYQHQFCWYQYKGRKALHPTIFFL